MALAEDLQLNITDIGDADIAHMGLVGVGLDTPGSIDSAMRTVLNAVRDLPTEDAIGCTNRYSGQIVALEAELLARNKQNGASDRNNEELASKGRPATKRETKKRVRRGNAVDHNPDLAGDLANGDIGTEQLDAIANASAKTGGAAAKDETLIDEIKNSPPDAANSITKKWLENHDRPDGDGADKRYERQRRLREAVRFETEDGLAAILLKGDDETIDATWKRWQQQAKALFNQDGGRDLPANKHPRTRKQRLFDAATANSGPTSTSSSNTATIYIWQTLDDFLAGSSRAHFGDGRTVPTSVFDRYRCSATLINILFDQDGELLYTGRQKRFATQAQIRGLIARDKGCVRCGADPAECEAHHLIPWNAPAQGKTDITNLALVCTDCHHYIHDTKQTLHRDRHGKWKLRPATPNETPPPRQRTQVQQE